MTIWNFRDPNKTNYVNFEHWKSNYVHKCERGVKVIVNELKGNFGKTISKSKDGVKVKESRSKSKFDWSWSTLMVKVKAKVNIL